MNITQSKLGNKLEEIDILIRNTSGEMKLALDAHKQPLQMDMVAFLPFFQTLDELHLSTRLRNVLKVVENKISWQPTFLDFLEDNCGFRNLVLSQPNLGKKTGDELIKAVNDIVHERKVFASPTDSQCHPDLLPPIPKEIVNKMLGELDPRSADILRRRYGIGLLNSETLEQIASSYHVTRERIRQLEKNALAFLSHGARGNRIKQSIDNHSAVLFNTIIEKHCILLHEDIHIVNRTLDAETILAIEAIYHSIQAWLGSFAFRGDLGWVLEAEVDSNISYLASVLEERLKECNLPLSLSLISPNNSDIKLLWAAVQTLGLNIYRGYVCTKKIGIRKRRTIRLHRMLVEKWPKSPPLRQLVSEYRYQNRDDQCSVRDALIVMEAAPHLFLPIMEDQWAAINITQNKAISINTELTEVNCNESNGKDIDEQCDESVSMASALEQLLENLGPLRFSELREKALNLLPQGISPSSIGPILMISGRFIRIAPGFYALPSQLEAIANDKELPQGMLSIDQCRWFIQGIRSGCRHGEFPAWNWRLELELCRWAERDHVDSAIFHSLLSVVQPEKWNTSRGNQNYWSRIKALNSEYCLDHPTPTLSAFCPTLDCLAAAALKVIEDGGINWITINRVLGKRIDHTGAASALALLVSAGVLKATDHWQDYHQEGERAKEFFFFVTAELGKDGKVDWFDKVGQEIIEFSKHRVEVEELGWIHKAKINELLSELLMDHKTQLIEDDETNIDPLDSLLAAMRIKRRGQVLDSLSDEFTANLN